MQTDPTLTPQANQLLDQLYAERRRTNRQGWLRSLIIAGVCIAILGLSYALPAAEVKTVTEQKTAEVQKKDSLANQAASTADTQLALCLAGDETAKKLEATGACNAAKALKQAAIAAAPTPIPGLPGKTGASGQDGRGIVGTAIVDGRFKITYTDGQTEDKGVIKGDRGIPGRSITGSTISNGRLTLTYSDSTTEDVGQVVGKDGTNGANGINGQDGKNGEDGKPGRGISSLTQVNGHLMVTYTDGTTADVGPLPSGAKGNDGAPPAGWKVENPDDSTTTCQRTTNFDYSNPYYDCTRAAAPAPLPTTGG